MQTTFLTLGLVCVAAAIVGGGLKAFGIELPLVHSPTRQVLLGFFGLISVAVAFQFGPNPNNAKLYDEAMQGASLEMAQRHYSVALDDYEKAANANPKRWEPVFGQGQALLHQGKYNDAVRRLTEAFEKQGKTNGSILHGLAYAEEGAGQLPQAIAHMQRATALLPPSAKLHAEAVFDLGRLDLKLWLKDEAPKDSKLYDEAKANFLVDLESASPPFQWTHYYLACLSAKRAEDPALPPAAATSLQREARIHLQQAVFELVTFQGDKAREQKDIMRNLLMTPPKEIGTPGNPLACPALIRAWAGSGATSIDALLAQLE